MPYYHFYLFQVDSKYSRFLLVLYVNSSGLFADYWRRVTMWSVVVGGVRVSAGIGAVKP